MPSAQRMVSETRGIGQLLNERRYFTVPPHQRDYAWPPGAVDQFLTDVIGAMEAGDADYFLGLIVLVDTDNPALRRYEILDGQQRLATATMVFAAIRQWLRDKGLDEEALKIQNEFIGVSEIGESRYEPRVVLNVNNRELFQEVVVNPCPEHDLRLRQAEAGRHTSNRKLIDAALLCRELVEDLALSKGEDKASQADVLFRLAIFLRDHVQVNCLDVTAPEDAYTIFESLNDRGIDLSVLDLLKNHLLREAGSGAPQILHNWSQMVGRIGDRRADDFLKTFWTARFGRIQRGRLFRELRARFHTKGQVLSLSKELNLIADSYASLEIADSDLWKAHTSATQEHVRVLSLLGAKQTHPILLAALERFGSSDMQSLLRNLVSLILRYQLVGRGRTGRLEIAAANVAASIYSKKLKSPAAVWAELRKIIPDNEEFREDFSRYEETRPQRARWILRELENQAWRKNNPGKGAETMPIADPELVTLEHILPRNPGAAWKSVVAGDKGLASECRHRLGNFCLLSKPGNKSEGNKDFTSKRKSYGSSEFILTRELAEIAVWDREAIEKRQHQMSVLALLAWPT